jgi:hypothetical protein
VVGVALAAWVAAWLVAAVAVFQSIRELEDGGRAVVTAGEGLDETSEGLERAAQGISETAGALGALGDRWWPRPRRAQPASETPA